MPKVAYSEIDRNKIKEDLIETGLELFSKQGIQHTTVVHPCWHFKNLLLHLFPGKRRFGCTGLLLSAAQNLGICEKADG